MFRRVGSVSAIVVVLLTIASPAFAKLPPFETEVSVDGNTATVTIRFDGFYESGELTEDFLPETLEGLFALYSAETLDANNRPQATASGEPVTVTEVTPGVYRGSIEVDHAGDWAIVAFPGATEVSGPPLETTVFTVPGGQPLQLITTVGAAALVAGTLLTVLVRRRGSALSLVRRTTSARPGAHATATSDQ